MSTSPAPDPNAQPPSEEGALSPSAAVPGVVSAAVPAPATSLPEEDQQVTIVSVRDGHISVLPARVLVTRPHKIALSLDAPSAEAQRWTDGQSLTLLYTLGEHIMRLRAELRERVADDRVTVEPIGDAKEGDRRDFRRADVDAWIRVRKCESRDTAIAREKQLATPIPDDSSEFELQNVNLSGSGVSFEAREQFDLDDLVDIRLVLGLRPRRAVAIIGRIVRRVRPDSPRPIIAARFAELSEADQDAVIYSVFAAHFANVGLDEELNPDE